jgi:hypothetical protein
MSWNCSIALDSLPRLNHPLPRPHTEVMVLIALMMTPLEDKARLLQAGETVEPQLISVG